VLRNHDYSFSLQNYKNYARTWRHFFFFETLTIVKRNFSRVLENRSGAVISRCRRIPNNGFHDGCKHFAVESLGIIFYSEYTECICTAITPLPPILALIKETQIVTFKYKKEENNLR